MYIMGALVLLLVAQSFCRPQVEFTTGNSQGIQRIMRSLRDPSTAAEGMSLDNLHKIRTRRSSESEDCERLELCRLHAHSGRSFMETFQLYFVNKENARLWDHQRHTAEDCERRFAGCRGGRTGPAASAARASSARASAAAAASSREDFVEEDDY